jgi:hypothetical protein
MDNDICIQLGRRFCFNVLHVIVVQETEKAIKLQSINSDRFLWIPKKALKQDKECKDIFNLQHWFKLDNWAEIFILSNMRIPFSTTHIL